MYELDKAAFGHFLAQLRREKGMTQKELAATLYVSDKAVSKWERGLSVPDISLLVPLAEQLNVTHSAAHNPAQNIAASFVGRQNTVGNKKCG